MKQLFFALTILCLTSILACTKTIYIPIDRRHEEYITLRDTIIEIINPGESHYNHTCDTTSLLQGNGAYSVATISNGTLHHSLTIKPRHDSITIQVKEVHPIDSIPYMLSFNEKEEKTTHTSAYHLIFTAIASILAICIFIVMKIRKK